MNSSNNYDFPQSAPTSGVWPFVNNIYAESLIDVLHESVFHVNEPNSVLGKCNKCCRDLEVFYANSHIFQGCESSLKR